MPIFKASDFQSIIHKNGNVFFNQNTGRLDTRGGNFLSRVVTWIRAKYNPNKISREYKTATDTFITEVKRRHNDIFRAYDSQYEINENNLDRLYQLGGADTPLAMRHIRQVLARLDAVPVFLEMANAYSDPKYCREEIAMELSKSPGYYGHYQPSDAEIEKLSVRIKDAIVDEIYQQKGLLTDDLVSSIVHQTIEEYTQSPAVKIMIDCSDPGDCEKELSSRLSKELLEHFEYNTTDTEELSLRIQNAIREEADKQGGNITQTEASAIKLKIINQHTSKLNDTLSKKKALYKETAKKHIAQKTTLSAVRKTTKQYRSMPTQRTKTFIATNATKDKHGQSLSSVSPAAQEPSPKPSSSSAISATKENQRKPSANSRLSIPSPEEDTEKLQKKLADLPETLKQQLRTRQIDNKEKLVQESNKYMANKVAQSPLREYYFSHHKKVFGEAPILIPKNLIEKVQTHIQSTPMHLTSSQAEEHMRKAVVDYIDHLKLVRTQERTTP